MHSAPNTVDTKTYWHWSILFGSPPIITLHLYQHREFMISWLLTGSSFLSLSSLIYEDLVFALGKRGPVFCDGIFRVCSNFHNFFNVLSDDKGNDSVKGRSLDLDLSRKCSSKKWHFENEDCSDVQLCIFAQLSWQPVVRACMWFSFSHISSFYQKMWEEE